MLNLRQELRDKMVAGAWESIQGFFPLPEEGQWWTVEAQVWNQTVDRTLGSNGRAYLKVKELDRDIV